MLSSITLLYVLYSRNNSMYTSIKNLVFSVSYSLVCSEVNSFLFFFVSSLDCVFSTFTTFYTHSFWKYMSNTVHIWLHKIILQTRTVWYHTKQLNDWSSWFGTFNIIHEWSFQRYSSQSCSPHIQVLVVLIHGTLSLNN